MKDSNIFFLYITYYLKSKQKVFLKTTIYIHFQNNFFKNFPSNIKKTRLSKYKKYLERIPNIQIY